MTFTLGSALFLGYKLAGTACLHERLGAATPPPSSRGQCPSASTFGHVGPGSCGRYLAYGHTRRGRLAGPGSLTKLQPAGLDVDAEVKAESRGQASKGRERRLVVAGLQPGDVRLPHTE